MSSVVFRPLADNDLPTLVEWFAEPAIARWWNQPANLASVRAKYLPRIEGREATSMWIAEIGGHAAGLFQCSLHVEYPQHDMSLGVPDAVGIDYLLEGAGFTRRGGRPAGDRRDLSSGSGTERRISRCSHLPE